MGGPAIVQKDKVIYFAHPIFAQYHKNAPRWCKLIFLNALEILLPEPLVRLEAPTTTLVTINEQPNENRWIMHLLHYIPERRGKDIDVIEDVIPLYNVKVSVKAEKKIKEVLCVPEMKKVRFKQRGGRIEFILQKVVGHQMVALQY